MKTFKQALPISLLQMSNRFLVALFILVTTFSCTKEELQPVNNVDAGIDKVSNVVQNSIVVQNFKLSASELVLLEENALQKAISFTWDTTKNSNIVYTLQAAMAGSGFEEPLNLFVTEAENITLTVGELNVLLSKLRYANTLADVEFRIKSDARYYKPNPSYSRSAFLRVSTFKKLKTFNDVESYLSLPGNYQGWDLGSAPKIISSLKTGEYDGFVHFPNNEPEILIVKANSWRNPNVYSFTGEGKIGFGGTKITINDGNGIYLFKVNTNTGKYKYSKINTWGLQGTAINT